jgi:hypothetical protein
VAEEDEPKPRLSSLMVLTGVFFTFLTVADDSDVLEDTLIESFDFDEFTESFDELRFLMSFLELEEGDADEIAP